jgi:hypothetical protein
MVTETVTASKQSAATDITVNRFGRKKGDIKVRPGDKPGVIFVDCPANEYGKYPPIEFATPEVLEQLDPDVIREKKLAAMTPEEREKEIARFNARMKELDEINKRLNFKFEPGEIKNWKYRTYGYDPDYYERIHGTHEEIYGAYEELYGGK